MTSVLRQRRQQGLWLLLEAWGSDVEASADQAQPQSPGSPQLQRQMALAYNLLDIAKALLAQVCDGVKSRYIEAAR